MAVRSVQDLACFIRYGNDDVRVFVNDVYQPHVSWFDENFSNSIRFVLPNKLIVLDVCGTTGTDLDRIEIDGQVACVYLRA